MKVNNRSQKNLTKYVISHIIMYIIYKMAINERRIFIFFNEGFKC